jgi:serine/threonine protein kinase
MSFGLLFGQARNLTRIHHKNLVSLVGYCNEGDYLALVYEHMSEGNLQDKLRGVLFFAGKSCAISSFRSVAPQY